MAKKPKKPMGLRLSEQTVEQIRWLAKRIECSQAEVVEAAVEQAYKRTRSEGEKSNE